MQIPDKMLQRLHEHTGKQPLTLADIVDLCPILASAAICGEDFLAATAQMVEGEGNTNGPETAILAVELVILLRLPKLEKEDALCSTPSS
jgi:hypothetical protein